MKKITFLYIVALLFTSVVWGAVSDIVVGQRAGGNQRFVQRVVTGTANTYKPVGFSSDGTFEAISQIRGATLGTPDGLSNIDITTNGTIRITANGTNSINTSTRKLFNSSGAETFDWNSNILQGNWTVGGSFKVGSKIVTGTPLATNAINTSVALNTKTVSANTTFTFSATPAVGQVFDLDVKNSGGSEITITIPSSKDASTGASITSLKLIATTGRRVLSWRYDGTDYILTRVGSGAETVFPLTTSADFGGFNASNIGIVTATNFVGDGSAITDLNAAELVGTIPSLSTGLLTTQKARVVTPVAGVSNVIVTDNGDTTITLNDATETLTYSNTPPDGTRFEYTLTGQATATTVNIPETYSNALGSLRSTFTVPALKNANIVVKREAGRYVMWGDPVSITDYPANTTPTVDGILEVDQAGSSTRSTLGQVKTLMSASPTFTGIVTNSGATANTAAAMAANAIDVTKELNTKTISANTTFTFSGTPAANQWFGLYVKNTSAAIITVTFPNSKDSVSGAVITTATIAATAGRQHLYWRYDGSEYIIYRGSGDALLIGGNNWSGNQVVTGNVTASLFTGEGSGLTSLAAAELIGTIPDITTETLTTARSRVVTPTAGVDNVINTSNGETTITLTATTATLSYSPIPANGTRFEYSLIGHTSDCVVTIPATYSYNTGGLRTTFTVPANKLATIWVKKEATRYVMTGDPTYLADLPVTTTPSTTSLIEIDQGTGSQTATLANIKKALRLGTKRTGSIATGGSGNTTLDFELADSYIYYVGGTATHNLPDAAANENCDIVYIFNGNYVITLLPDSNDFIRYGATTLSDSLGITITGTTGQTAVILSDGTNWSTTGGTATFSNVP